MQQVVRFASGNGKWSISHGNKNFIATTFQPMEMDRLEVCIKMFNLTSSKIIICIAKCKSY